MTYPWQNHFRPPSIRPDKIQFCTSKRHFSSKVCNIPDSGGFSANSPLCVRGLSRAPMSYLSTFSRTTFSIFGMGSFVCRYGAARGGEVEILPIQYIIVRERNGAYPGKRVYRAGLKSGPQVAKSLQASWDRSGKQQQEQNSPNLGTTFFSHLCT